MNEFSTPTFEHLVSHCLFCEPELHGQKSQILLRSDNFYLFAGLGAIVDGYIIIAPYRCDHEDLPMRSVSEFPPELMDEFVFLRSLVSRFYKETYDSDGMSFEHGRAGSCLIDRPGTQHCYHGHLCCYPVSFPIWDDMEGLRSESINCLHDLGGKVRSAPYLLVEASPSRGDAVGEMPTASEWSRRVVIMGSEQDLESQYLRRLLANRIGATDLWNWRDYPTVEAAQHLVVTFTEWLKGRNEYEVNWEPEGPRLSFVQTVSHLNQIASDRHRHVRAIEKHETSHASFGRFLRHLSGRNGMVPRTLNVGRGSYTNVLAGLGIECVGIELSKLKITEPKKGVGGAGEGQSARLAPEHVAMDAATPKPPAGNFDGILIEAFSEIPRVEIRRTLERVSALLGETGVLYFTAEIGNGLDLHPDGQVRFQHIDAELCSILHEYGLVLIERWDEACADAKKNDPHRRSYVFRKRLERSSPIERVAGRKVTLGDLGEDGVLARIKGFLPSEDHKHIALGIGDDCAAIAIDGQQLVVATIDPCPLPVISMLGDRDPWHDGWFSMIISLSDLGAMGATPLGIMIAIEAQESMAIDDLERFYEGIVAAAKAYNCPIIGGNIKDGPRFSCVGAALGAVSPQQMLRRDRAQPGERLVILGDMGRFWAGVIQHMHAMPISAEAHETLFENLKRPRPKLREGRLLAEQSLSRCALDSSDGLTSCFYEIAEAGDDVDVHVDLSNTPPDPLVQDIADRAGIDVRKLMLAWGDWQLVCTVPEAKMAQLREAMASLGCPISTVGWISEGNGAVWYHDKEVTGRLTNLASKRFTRQSYFSHGLESYLEALRHSPLYA